MDAVVEAASDHDVIRCLELWTRVITARDGTEFAEEVTDRALASFALPRVRFAVIGSAPDGFALTVNQEPGVALLSRVCVDPSASGRGLGAALVADAVEHARHAGFTRLELDVRTTNIRAIALYARTGFTAASEPWEYDGGDLVQTWSRDLEVKTRPDGVPS